MNSATVSSFLKRRARIRTRKATNPSPRSGNGEPLQIIPELSEEEDSPRASCSSSLYSSPPSPVRSISPLRAVKAKRRQGNLRLGDIRISRDSLVYHDEDISTASSLLCSPRPAPQPPASPPSLQKALTCKTESPDPFRLTFYEMGASFNFPQPPLSASRSSFFDLSGLSSPSYSSTSSQDSSPSLQSVGLPTTPSSSDDEFLEDRSSLSFLCPSIRPLVIAKNSSSCKDDDEFDISVYASPELLQPYKNDEELLHSPVEQTSDTESDIEEASDWYTRELGDVLTLCSPLPPSLSLRPSRPESISSPISPSTPPRSRRHSKPLPSPPRPVLPSAQLDPAFPRPLPAIPKYAPPPPPVPAIPEHLRPMPRMSIPVDLDLFRDDADDEYDYTSAYVCSPAMDAPSEYSQPEGDCDVEFDVDVQFEFDMDLPMRLPLSIPGTPIDFEADLAHAFEEVRLRNADAPVAVPPPTQPSTHLPQSPLASCFEDEDEELAEASPSSDRMLRSRWSASTFDSVMDERPSLSPSSKLRSYFGSVGAKKLSSPRKASISSPPSTPSRPRRHTRGASAASDVMVIGYGYPTSAGVRRRGSTSSSSVSGSDAGSFDSACSSGSTGLRRKPIPVEMFLRSAA